MLCPEGASGWTEFKENGVQYSLDVTKCVASPLTPPPLPLRPLLPFGSTPKAPALHSHPLLTGTALHLLINERTHASPLIDAAFFPAARVMFSSGNGTEKARMGRVAVPGEVVVDLYCGIGRAFAVPDRARRGPSRAPPPWLATEKSSPVHPCTRGASHPLIPG